VRGEEVVDVLGTGVADSLEEALRRFDLGLDDREASVLLRGDLEDRRADSGESFLVGLDRLPVLRERIASVRRG
jgi:hypothetical protein